VSCFSLSRASLELSDTQVCVPSIPDLLGTAARFCEVVDLKLTNQRSSDYYEHTGIHIFISNVFLDERVSSSSVLLASLELSDTQVYEPQIRALFGTAAHLCTLVVLKLRCVAHIRQHQTDGAKKAHQTEGAKKTETQLGFNPGEYAS